MSASNAKFKVGDRVRFNVDYGKAKSGDEGTITDFWEQGIVVNVDDKGPHSCFENRVSAVVPPSPIRTVTRREIVPGVYGRIKISANVYALNIHTDKTGEVWTADQLREAAHLFNQLAEVLEENAAKAAA